MCLLCIFILPLVRNTCNVEIFLKCSNLKYEIFFAEKCLWRKQIAVVVHLIYEFRHLSPSLKMKMLRIFSRLPSMATCNTVGWNDQFTIQSLLHILHCVNQIYFAEPHYIAPHLQSPFGAKLVYCLSSCPSSLGYPDLHLDIPMLMRF